MPVLNFQKQFAGAVKSGKKRQTIRAPRKYPIKKGDTLYLYTGMRTKKAVKLNEVVCRSTWVIKINENGYNLQNDLGQFWIVSNRQNHILIMNSFAQSDGFKDWDDMIRWFEKTHGLPFKGTLIEW